MVKSTRWQPDSVTVATASAGLPGPARNVSVRVSPKPAGQLDTPGGFSDRPSMSAASLRTFAWSVMVTGACGFLLPWFMPRSSLIVTAFAAKRTFSLAGRAGIQLTWASTRIAVLLPSATTSTSSSRELSTPGTSDSENMPSQVGSAPAGPDPLPVPADENRCARCAASQASTCCGAPGASHQPALSTKLGVPRTWSGCSSTPPLTLGALDSFRAPGGTANEAKIAPASAAARRAGVGACFAADRATVNPVPDDAVPVGWPTAPFAGAGTTAQPARATTAAPPRARAPRVSERPATFHRGSSLIPLGRGAARPGSVGRGRNSLLLLASRIGIAQARSPDRRSRARASASRREKRGRRGEATVRSDDEIFLFSLGCCVERARGADRGPRLDG